MTSRENLLERLAELAELGHAASPGFIREVAEDAFAALSLPTMSDSNIATAKRLAGMMGCEFVPHPVDVLASTPEQPA